MHTAGRTLLSALLFVGAVSTAWPRAGEGQQGPPRITVRVRQVAGPTLYLDVGSRHGIVTGDTLTVLGDSAGSVVGRLVVTAGTETRSVLTFAGPPFPVTRGADLTLQLLRQPEEIPPTPTVPQPTAPRPTPTVREPSPVPSENVATSTEASAPEQGRRPAHGRLALDLSAVRSNTRVGGADPVDVARTFATPAMRLDLTVPDAVGGLRLRTNMRLAYRYSDRDIVQPAASARVYALALEGELSHDVRIELGRFRSSWESYSGFWDGALVRLGGTGFGVGAIAGFEPDRWDERPSSAMPKASIFIDGRQRGPGWRWSGDLSAHAVRPKDAEPDHTFLGASQRLSAGPVRLSHDVQVDRDPAGGSWRLSRLRLRASVALTPAVEIRAGLGRSEPWLYGLSGSPFGFRRDRADAGLALRGAAGYLALDASVTKDASGARTWGSTGTFVIDHLPGPEGLGAFASLSRWSGPYGTSISAAPALSLDLSPAWVRLGYRLNRSDYLGRVSLTHAIEGSLDVPFSSGLRVSARVRAQFGDLSSQSFALSLYRIF